MMAKVWFWLALCLLLVSHTTQAQVVIVVNPSAKASEIAKSALADIFTGGSTSFKDGSHAVPVTLKGGVTHEDFLKTYVGKNDGAFRAAWRAAVFSGQGTMPRTFDSEAALLDYVAATAGAIGYVSKDSDRSKVKTLDVR